MNYQIAGGQVGKGIEFLTVGGGFLGCFPPGFGFGDKLAFRKHCQLGQGVFHAIGQGALSQKDLARLGHSGQRNAKESGQPFIPKHFLQ